MTLLEKPVHRKTRGAYSVLYARPRQIIVSLMPGDLLQFREAGRRTKYTIPVDLVMKQAVKAAALAEFREKQKARKARKAGRV